MKKVAFACMRSRIWSTRRVLPGQGPSSNVSATAASRRVPPSGSYRTAPPRPGALPRLGAAGRGGAAGGHAPLGVEQPAVGRAQGELSDRVAEGRLVVHDERAPVHRDRDGWWPVLELGGGEGGRGGGGRE